MCRSFVIMAPFTNILTHLLTLEWIVLIHNHLLLSSFMIAGCCTVSLFFSIWSSGGVSVTRQDNTTLDSKRVSYQHSC